MRWHRPAPRMAREGQALPDCDGAPDVRAAVVEPRQPDLASVSASRWVSKPIPCGALPEETLTYIVPLDRALPGASHAGLGRCAQWPRPSDLPPWPGPAHTPVHGSQREFGEGRIQTEAHSAHGLRATGLLARDARRVGRPISERPRPKTSDPAPRFPGSASLLLGSITCGLPHRSNCPLLIGRAHSEDDHGC
jgi:hypothetical protein